MNWLWDVTVDLLIGGFPAGKRGWVYGALFLVGILILALLLRLVLD